MERVEIIIVGAGVVGLAIAAELSKEYSDIVVIEKNDSFGQEASSRNSEVIHAGIYYPKDSLKARLCVEGKDLLYRFCQEHNIGHNKVGKLIVAVEENEEVLLEELLRNGLDNGVEDLRIISKKEAKILEPHVVTRTAIYSGTTGIVDSHSLMKTLERESKSQHADIAYATELVGIEKSGHGYKITVNDQQEGLFTFMSRVFINAAGLYSDRVARMAGINREEYTLHYCKGEYFRVHHNKARFLSHLVYPVPAQDSVSLGIHTVLDLAGGLRLGPDAEYVDKIEYDVSEPKKRSFFDSAASFLPFLELRDLEPDMAGIRAKLQGRGETFRDFLIQEESSEGFRGFVNLIGIDSPGLTCALSIARKVKNIVQSL